MVGEYRRLEGMQLDFVSGLLKQDGAQVLGYEVTFRLSLDFTHFVHMSNQFIPGYLLDPKNAIRPQLGGLAYHYSYNFFYGAAGTIDGNEALFAIFDNPIYYMNGWSSGGLERRYARPGFRVVDNMLEIVARQDFRWQNGAPVYPKDLPLITFDWSLNILQGYEFAFPPRTPVSVMTLGYAQVDMVDIGGIQVRRGTRYMVGSDLQIGLIPPEKILVANP